MGAPIDATGQDDPTRARVSPGARTPATWASEASSDLALALESACSRDRLGANSHHRNISEPPALDLLAQRVRCRT